MTVLIQCKLWLLPALFILHCTKSGPPPSLSRCSITGSQTRAQQVEWCRCTVHVFYTSRSDRLLFRLWERNGPATAPQRSALVRDFPLSTILLIQEYYSPLQAAKSGYYCDNDRFFRSQQKSTQVTWVWSAENKSFTVLSEKALARRWR